MRLILYSDLQLKSYASYSKVGNDGINDRLKDHINVLDQIYDYGTSNGIKHIVFAGDGLDDRGRIGVVDTKMYLQWKQKVSSSGIQQYDLIGNHDLVMKSHKHNSLDLFSYLPNTHIVDEPRWEIIDNKYGIYFVPYLHRLDDIKEALKNCKPPLNLERKNCIAIVHYGLFDTEVSGRIIIKDEGFDQEGQIRLEDLGELLKYVEHAWFGHFHCTTSLTNRVHFIGPPIQHNWGEKSLKPRFLDIDMDSGTYSEVVTNSPRFIDFEDKSKIVKSLVPNNFVRVKTEKLSEKDELRSLLLSYGARAADVVIVPKSDTKPSNTAMNLSMSFLEMGKKLIQIEKPEDLDTDKLELILSEALKEASVRLS